MMKDPLDSEKTMMNLENSLGDMPTLRLDDTSIGRVDRYELLEKLGEGGFGAVYGARDTEAGILVALKALPGEISRDAEEMAQIRDNFALVSRLHHPNIASVLHLHRVEDADERAQTALGVHESDYLVVMEYALGATLFSMRRALSGQKMEFVQALEICRPIAEALDYAHSQKVLHRDIKPKNIMVAPGAAERGADPSERAASSTVKVLDFGLAAEIRSSMSRKSKDLQQSKSGTPFYMAPEQWRGVSQGPATDQYALAAMLYEQVSGAVPFKSAFDSGNFEIMRNAACNEPVSALKELTKKQNAVLLRALAKDPDERFASCGDFIAALGGRPVSRKSAKGSKKLVAGLLVVGLLAGGIYAFKDATPRRALRTLALETQAQVDALLGEARTALTMGDLDVTTERAQAVLKLSADHAEAQTLLLEVEKKAGERKAREAKVDAELAFEKLDRDIPDRGQGFEAKFETLRKSLRIAKDAHASRSWGQAFTAFKGVQSGCDSLRARDVSRKDAKAQRDAAGNQQKNAMTAKADELAKKDFEKGGASALRAEKAFESGHFESASKDWNNAAQEYVQAKTLASAVTAYSSAKSAYEKAIRTMPYETADLRTHAPEPWAGAEKAARLGKESAAEPVQGRKHYETALAKYTEAVQTTAPHLDPQMKVIPTPANATIQLIAEGHELDTRSGRTATLKKNQRYTLTVSKQGFKTFSETLAANWNGLKEKRITLEGRKWVADLGGGVTMDFMPIAAGSFQMGSNNGAQRHPVHKVTLSKPFWMAKTEVTQAQWLQIRGSGGNPSDFKELQNPVEKVSWHFASAFCKNLTERERKAGRLPAGYGYALPTEAQWEYACRAGTTGDYAGSLDAMGWYDKNSGKKTHPVGTKQANAWGLYDMHGNVYEWCADEAGNYKSGSVTDPYKYGNGWYDKRVIRGGSWRTDATNCQSAFRAACPGAYDYDNVGFRPKLWMR